MSQCRVPVDGIRYQLRVHPVNDCVQRQVAAVMTAQGFEGGTQVANFWAANSLGRLQVSSTQDDMLQQPCQSLGN